MRIPVIILTSMIGLQFVAEQVVCQEFGLGVETDFGYSDPITSENEFGLGVPYDEYFDGVEERFQDAWNGSSDRPGRGDFSLGLDYESYFQQMDNQAALDVLTALYGSDYFGDFVALGDDAIKATTPNWPGKLVGGTVVGLFCQQEPEVCKQAARLLARPPGAYVLLFGLALTYLHLEGLTAQSQRVLRQIVNDRAAGGSPLYRLSLPGALRGAELEYGTSFYDAIDPYWAREY